VENPEKRQDIPGVTFITDRKLSDTILCIQNATKKIQFIDPKTKNQLAREQSYSFDDIADLRDVEELRKDYKKRIDTLKSLYGELSFSESGKSIYHLIRGIIDDTLKEFGGINEKGQQPGNISVQNMVEYLSNIGKFITTYCKDNQDEIEHEQSEIKKLERLAQKSMKDDWPKSFNWWQIIPRQRGAGAKASAVNFLNNYSSYSFRIIQKSAEIKICDEILGYSNRMLDAIKTLQSEIKILQKDYETQRDTAFDDLKSVAGLNYYVLTREDELLRFKPEWNEKNTLRSWVQRPYQCLISAIYDSEEIESEAQDRDIKVFDFISYVLKLIEIRNSNHAQHKKKRDEEAFLNNFRNNTDALLDLIFDHDKNACFKEEIDTLSIWSYLMREAVDSAGEKRNKETDASYKSRVRENIEKIFMGYLNSADVFGKKSLDETRLLPPILKITINFNRKVAESVLEPIIGKEEKDKFFNKIDNINAKTDDENSTEDLSSSGNASSDKITFRCFDHRYETTSFDRLSLITTVTENPEEYKLDWVDQRYVHWFLQRRNNKYSNINSAICGLAFVWRDKGDEKLNSGLIWSRDKSKNTDYFSFPGVKTCSTDGLDWLFTRFPTESEAWNELLVNLGKIWEKIPPKDRAEQLKLVLKALDREEKRRKTPQWQKYFQEARQTIANMAKEPDTVMF
jgi:hypothetical protein